MEIKASIIGDGSEKSIKALNRVIRWGRAGIVYQPDPWHVDVLVAMHTPVVDNVREENPLRLSPKHAS